MFRELEEDELTTLKKAKREVYKFMNRVEKELKATKELLADHIFIIDKKYFDVFMEDEDFRNSSKSSIHDYGGFRFKRGEEFGLIDSPADYE